MDLESITQKESDRRGLSKRPNLFKMMYNHSSEYINYKMGIIYGLIGGGIVYKINEDYGLMPAITASGKQFLYNLLVAGFNIKTCEKLAKGVSSKYLSLFASTVVPTLQAFLINYGIHKFSGTPEAFDSSIWQVAINTPFFLVTGLAYRKSYETQNNLNQMSNNL